MKANRVKFYLGNPLDEFEINENGIQRTALVYTVGQARAYLSRRKRTVSPETRRRISNARRIAWARAKAREIAK
jgi:hypothetical protein